MKKAVSFLLCMVLLLPLVGCNQNDEPEWRKKVDSIEAGMTYEELVALMGEPDADIGSGAINLMYLLPDEHVTVIGMHKDFTQEGNPLAVVVKPAILTYDEFCEHFKYYPDDPNAWWIE